MITSSVLQTLQKTGCLIVPVFESETLDSQLKELDKRFNGFLSRVIASKDFDGKRMQVSLLYVQDTDVPRILLLGLGKESEIDLGRWKHLVGTAVTHLQGKKVEELAISIPQLLKDKYSPSRMALETYAAAEVADYAFDMYKQKDAQVTPIKRLDFIEPKKNLHKDFLKGIKEGHVIAEATNFTRHLGNTPPHVMTPAFLASEAQKLGKENKNIKVKILSRPEIQKLKMGCFLGVAQGSDLEPKFIIVEYNGGSEKQKPTVLVGKGITFDSGGISLKPGDYLTDMKFDMLGGATVLGTIKAIAALGVKKNVVGLIPACENMPSGKAYRPDDILVAMNGLSVEIVNTDAEGRLILADALCYAARYNPKEVIDFATLTGHALISIGNERSALFTQNEEMCKKLTDAGAAVGESLWRLPLGEEFTDAVKGTVADLINSGGVGHPRYAGASTAAAFLEHFVSYPWAHVDLSCSHYNKNKSWVRAGANGFGVQTMVEYLKK